MKAGKKEPASARRVDEGQSSSQPDADRPADASRERSPSEAEPTLRKLAEDVAKAEDDPTSNAPPANPNTND